MTTVLVADDDPDIRDLITWKLEQSGYLVLAAADGSAALDVLHGGHPDLALLDIRMPGASGTEICRYARTVPELAHLPIILVTASPMPGDLALGLAAGADDYLLKPFSPRELARRIAAVRPRPARPARINGWTLRA
jgi:two-component system, OmpR family, phosphate regulon response regulator PhoB